MKTKILNCLFFCLILALSTTCTSVQTTGQSSDRTNDPLPFVMEIKQMNPIIGWSKWSNGKWNSKKNLIPDEKEVGYVITGSQGIDNIKSLKMYSVNFENQEYILLQKRYVEGAFKYPNIKMDFYKYDVYNYYLFKKDDFKIIISKNEVFLNNLVIYRYFSSKNNLSINKIAEETFAAINNESGISKLLYASELFIIPTYYNEKDNVVRFLFDTHTKDESLSMFYFETDYNIFNNFFEPVIQ
jgi:hypothetical protein